MSLRRPVFRRSLGTFLVALLLGVPFVAGNALASGPHPAQVVVQDLVAEVAEVVVHDRGAAGEEGLVAALVPVLASRTDIALIGRLALGRHWRTAAPEQREEYQTLFRTFMLRSLAARLHPHAGTTLRAEDVLRVTGVRPAGRADVIVATEMEPPGRPALHVDWRLREREGGHVIIDFAVEGISLLVTQREDFAAVIERGGLPGLLEELRARTPTPT